jgi:hypothetical protein
MTTHPVASRLDPTMVKLIKYFGQLVRHVMSLYTNHPAASM